MKKLIRFRSFPVAVKFLRGMVVFGITLSVATLCVTLSVVQGFEKAYQEKLLNFHASITILPEEGSSLSKEDLLARLKTLVPSPEVPQVSAFAYREGLLIHEGAIRGVLLKGVESEGEEKFVLGKALAKKMGIKPGEMVKVLLPQGEAITARDAKSLKVFGTFQSGLYEIDDQFALLSLDRLQSLLGVENVEKGFEIRLKNSSLAAAMASLLREALGPGYSVQDWMTLNAPLFEALQLEKMLFRLLIGFMVFVAALNLIGTILITVFRRKKTVAILSSLGMRKHRIRWLFALDGIFLGGLGVLCGAVLGVFLILSLRRFQWVSIDPQIYFLEKLPVAFSEGEWLAVVSLSLILVVLLSWFVAGQVSRIPIREGLHEPAS